MRGEPDPDWYLDHVLFYAEPGGGGSPIRVDEVTQWQAWWRARSRAVSADRPGPAQIALRQGFALTSAQALALGVGRPRARGLVGRGEWAAPVRGAVTMVGERVLLADRPDRWTA